MDKLVPEEVFILEDLNPEDEKSAFELFRNETFIPSQKELENILDFDDSDYYESDPLQMTIGQLEGALTLTKGRLSREREGTRELRKVLAQVKREAAFYKRHYEKEKNIDEQKRMLDRLPPHATEIEKTILGLYFVDPSLMDRFSQPYLNMMFYSEDHRRIHSIMIDLNKKIDAEGVKERLKREGILHIIGEKTIDELVERGKKANPEAIKRHIETVEDKFLARGIVHVATEALRSAWEESTVDEFNRTVPIKSYSEFIRGFSIKILKLLPWRFSKQYDLSAAVEEVIEDFEELKQRKGKPKISTGFKGLDRIMHGVQPHKLTVLGARTKMGKTTFGLNLMDNLANQGYASAIFSFESSRTELIQKLIAKYSGLDSMGLVYWDQNQMPKDDVEKILKAAEYVKSLPLHIDDSKPDLNYIIGRTEQLKAQHPNLGLVVVDGLQAFEGYKQYQGNKSDIYAEIIKKLKYLAVDCHLNVLLMTQLKAIVEKRKTKRPKDLEDFPDCKALPEVADVAFCLYRPEEYWPENPGYKGWVEVIPMAMRIGDKRDKGFKLLIDMRTSKITDYTPV